MWPSVSVEKARRLFIDAKKLQEWNTFPPSILMWSKQLYKLSVLIDQAVIGDCFLKSLWLITLIVGRDTLTECVLGKQFHWKDSIEMFHRNVYYRQWPDWKSLIAVDHLWYGSLCGDSLIESVSHVINSVQRDPGDVLDKTKFLPLYNYDVDHDLWW